MSKRVRLIIWWSAFIAMPFLMGVLHKKYGMAGLFPMMALAFLMGLSYYPHILGEKNGQ